METALKPPNIRGPGWSKVVTTSPSSFQNLSTRSVVVKTQYEYYCRPIWNAFRKTPLIHREMRALLALMRAGVAVPAVLAYEETPGQSSLTTTFIDNAASFDAALIAPGADRLRIIGSVARAIAHLHNTRWTHGALYPGHLLVVNANTEPTVYFVDLEKAKKWGSVSRDLRRFARYCPPFKDDEQTVFDSEYKKGRGSA